MLLGHTLVYIVCGLFLPAFVKACQGELGAMSVSVMIFLVQCLSFIVLPPTFGAFWMVAIAPMASQTLENAPFAWLEKQDGFDEHKRGLLTGWLNGATSAAKICTSFMVGPIIAACGGRAFAAFAFVAILQCGGLLILGCYRLFAGPLGGEVQSPRTPPIAKKL